MSQYPPLTGLVAAPYTAFRSDGSLNLARIEDQAASLVKNGVTGVFVCGTTGEGASLSSSERMLVAERWVQAAGSSLRVIVHVGHTVLEECRALAAHAEKLGASGIGSLAPYFFKPAATEELVAWCAEIAAAASTLPFYYYQIPSMTGVALPAADFLRAGSSRIPNLAGVKFTFENLMDFAECQRLEAGRYDIVFGRDEILVAGLALGARGAIGSTYNFLAPIFNELLATFARGDLAMAQEKQALANEVIAIFIRHGGLPAGKAIMQMIGVDCGPCRLPLRTLTPERAAGLRADLEKVGFFDFSSRA